MASVKAALALLALGAFTTAGPLQERQADVCESGVYRTLIPLFEANSMAQVYCSAARPACTTAGNEKRWMPASTTIDATTPPTTKYARELLPMTSWSGTGSSNSSMSSPDATALAWVALVEDQPDDVVATLCSCIGDYASCPPTSELIIAPLTRTPTPKPPPIPPPSKTSAPVLPPPPPPPATTPSTRPSRGVISPPPAPLPYSDGTQKPAPSVIPPSPKPFLPTFAPYPPQQCDDPTDYSGKGCSQLQPNSPNCHCELTTEGLGICTDALGCPVDDFHAYYQDCDTSSDCQADQVCIVNTNCGQSGRICAGWDNCRFPKVYTTQPRFKGDSMDYTYTISPWSGTQKHGSDLTKPPIGASVLKTYESHIFTTKTS